MSPIIDSVRLADATPCRRTRGVIGRPTLPRYYTDDSSDLPLSVPVRISVPKISPSELKHRFTGRWIGRKFEPHPKANRLTRFIIAWSCPAYSFLSCTERAFWCSDTRQSREAVDRAKMACRVPRSPIHQRAGGRWGCDIRRGWRGS